MSIPVRRALSAVLVLLALAAAVAVAAPQASPPKPVASVPEFEKECQKADDRIARLLQRAEISREQEKVREYRSYTPTRLADTTDRITAKDLYDIVKNKDVQTEVRAEAVEALTLDTPKMNDPHLSLEGGKGLRRPRADFSVDVVTNLGNNDDLTTRGLSNSILNGFWPAAGAREVDITKYDPRKKETWAPARSAWMRYLKR